MSSMSYDRKIISDGEVSIPKISVENEIKNYEKSYINSYKDIPVSETNLDLNIFVDEKNVIEEVTEKIDEFIEVLNEPIIPKIDNVIEKVKETAEPYLEELGKCGATVAVGATSILSGVLDVGESLLDGVVWCGSTVASWFGADTTKAKEFISRDLVTEANEAFYENTKLGQAINDASYMKYDSETAQGIREVSEGVTTFVAATATGGGALTVGLGVLSGVGNKSEEVYQKTTDTSLAQETGIFLKGVGEGLNWYAQGQLGQAAKNFFQVAKDPMINFINNMNFSTLKNTGAKIIQGAKSILSSIKNNGLDFIKSSIKNSSFASLQASDNLLDSIGIIGDNVSDWLIGDEEFNKTNALKATGELLGAWALNMFFDGASTTLTNKIQKAKLGTSFGARTLDLDITVRTIPISTLDEIIQNEELFNKFLDFDNNKDAFGEITQLELANAMKEYFESAKKNNIDLGFNNAELNRMTSIIDNFSIDVEKFYLDKLLSSYNSKYNDFMLYASNPEVILEPDFLLAMRSDWDEYLKNAAPDDPYAIAINQMREEFNINGFRCLARGIDVGETNFKIITDDLLTKDYVSPNTFIEIELYIEKYGYSLGYKGDYVYLQYKRRKAAEGFKDSLAQEIEKFTGSLVSQGKIESIQNSFRFQFKHVFEAESPHKNAMGYNDGTTSTICLGYDIPILKSIMNHESIHQVSHSDIKNDPQTGARISIAGISYSKFNTLTNKWSNQRNGMNEAITEYFNQLIMGVEYPPGNCGYEDAVEKLKSFIDMGIFSVDELKVAYFTNNPDIITGKLDAIGTQLGIKNYSDKIYKSFDKAIDDKGNIRTKGIQELNKILKEIQLAING